MFMINISDLFSLCLILAFTVLMIYLGIETKKTYVPAITLVAYLTLLVVYIIQFVQVPATNQALAIMITKCMAIDFLLILVSYLGYLWVDTVVAKEKGIESVDNSLEWLWKKV